MRNSVRIAAVGVTFDATGRPISDVIGDPATIAVTNAFPTPPAVMPVV